MSEIDERPLLDLSLGPSLAAAQTSNGPRPASAFAVALKTLEVTTRLQEWASLLGSLALFVWVAAAPDVLRLLGAAGFSVVALTLRWLHTHGGQ